MLVLGLQRALDTVNHNILLAKLNRKGFRGKDNLLINNYLSNTKQVVKINDTLSEPIEI